MKFDNESKLQIIVPSQRESRTPLSKFRRTLAAGVAATLVLVTNPSRAEDLLISAAASLTNAFKDIGTEFG